MQSGLKSISKIFSETLLRIPDYQRGYAWGAKQLKDFWGDLDQLPVNKSHYTGVLTLQPVFDYSRWEGDHWIIEAKKYTPLYIVDGQQRITTIVILLQCILDSIQNEAEINYTNKNEIQKKYIFESKDGGISRSYIFGYEKDNPSDDFLKRNIFQEDSDNHFILEETTYTKNLTSAKEFFLEKINLLSLKEIELIYTKVTQNLLFNIFYIEPELDVFVTFETMNNRGKLLSNLELIKNRLIYLSTKFDADQNEKDTLRRAVNESWKSVYHRLGKVASKKYDDDAFLRAHFFCYFVGKTLKDLDTGDDSTTSIDRYFHEDDFAKNYLLDHHFTVKRIYSKNKTDRLQLRQVYDYATNAKSFAEMYLYIVNPDSEPTASADEKTLLKQINRLGSYRMLPLTMAGLRTTKIKEKRVSLLKAIERLGFLSKVKAYLFYEIDIDEIAIGVLTKKISIDDAINKLNTFSTETVAHHEFVEALRTLGKSYYNWGAIRYFMYEYEQYLRTQSKSVRELLVWDEDDGKERFDIDHKTVEHIYPQRASHVYWKDRFNKYKIAERNLLKNSLGNLLPISQRKNSSLSNASFPEKLGSSTDQVGYKYGCLSEIQVSMEQEWTPLSILKRGVQLLGFLEKRWNIKIGSIEQKIDILGLTFIIKSDPNLLHDFKE